MRRGRRRNAFSFWRRRPREWRGGNSYFTAGAMRTTFGSLDDLRSLVTDLPDDLAGSIDLPPYTTDDFRADMLRVTEGRCDRELTEILVREAAPTLAWLRAKGLRFRLMFERQSFQVGGRRRFWGGLAVGVVGGGEGLVEQHLAAAARTGIEVRYESPGVGITARRGGTGQRRDRATTFRPRGDRGRRGCDGLWGLRG